MGCADERDKAELIIQVTFYAGSLIVLCLECVASFLLCTVFFAVLG